MPLYLAAIVIWALTARPRPIDTEKSPGRLCSPGRLACGLAVAVVLDGIALLVLRGDEHSNAAAWPWLASMAALGATAALAGRRRGWPPRWRGADRAVLRSPWTLLAVAVIVGIAETLRLVRLDSIPLGINADEGDRAALSLQVVHGDPTAGIFEGGWYRISMVYFWTLAQAMRIFGTSYADARILGALAGTVTVAAVTWIGLRHFGLRVGLIAGGLLAVAGVALQFSRETTEAAPTAMFWTISMAFLLEGVRSGRASSWIGAGMAGGAGLYFYPSGRSWVLLAALFLAYLTALGLGIPRRQILLRGALCLLAATLVMAPFLSYGARHPDVLFRRAAETTVLDRTNAARLGYYDPSWSMPRLVGEQVVRSLGILDRVGDQGGFWPTDRSILTPVLAVLTLLGLGWSCLRWRDPRAVLLGLWFAVGLAGVVFTVETPSLQRMAVAIPVLTLFAALVLDDLCERVAGAARWLAPRWRHASRWATGGRNRRRRRLDCVERVLVLLPRLRLRRSLGAAECRRAGGRAGGPRNARDHDRPFVPHGQLRVGAAPGPADASRRVAGSGSDLPLSLPARTGLAFMLYPDQIRLPAPASSALSGRHAQAVHTPDRGADVRALPPFAGGVGPKPGRARRGGGRSLHPRPHARRAARRVATLPGADAVVGRSARPAVRQLHVRGERRGRHAEHRRGPRHGDGRPRRATVALPAGMHAVELTATVAASGQTPLEWSGAPVAGSAVPLRPVATSELYSRQTHPVGLFGRIGVEGETWDRRIDGTLATCCLYDDVGRPGDRVTASWRGTLLVPRAGTYSMSVFSQGQLELRIDGRLVLRSATDADAVTHARPRLERGPHRLDVSYRVTRSPGGIEWMWTPPGGRSSIVPPSALRPPRAAGPQPPVSTGGPPGPSYTPLVVVP